MVASPRVGIVTRCWNVPNVLLGFRINRVLGCFFTVYLLVIMVGSVHIGWHYAVDGYVAIATTLILWKIVGCFFPQDEMETK